MRHIRSLLFLGFLALLLIPRLSRAQDLVELTGCVYDRSTGEPVSGSVVVRFFTREGIGGASLFDGGCYADLMINTDLGDGDAWDLLEVAYREGGKLYLDQRRLPANASTAGMSFLGLPEDTLRYDFFFELGE